MWTMLAHKMDLGTPQKGLAWTHSEKKGGSEKAT